MSYPAAGWEKAVSRRLLYGLGDASGGQGVQRGLQPVKQGAQLLVLVVGNFMPASSGALRVRNDIILGNRVTLCDPTLYQVPVAVDLLHGPRAVHLNSNGNGIGMPCLRARDEIAMPAASRVICVIGDRGKLDQAGRCISANDEVCGVARAQLGGPIRPGKAGTC